MGSAWPLVGRAEELAEIGSVLAGVGGYAGVLLAGDAGVGKSRLAHETVTAMSRRAEVRWVTATGSGRAVPLGAFAEWVGDAGSDPTVLVRGVVDSLTAGLRGRPVVVGIDDAHRLDDLSAFVVHQLARRRLAKVIVTVRNHETAPEVITALGKDSSLLRMELQPLSRDESERLLAAVFGGALDVDAAQRLWRLTQGNVLFLRILVEQELSSGRLRKQRGMWSWFDEPPAFTTLGELIDTQMGALSESVGEVVDLLAVGEPLDRDVLADLADRQAIDSACAKGLVALTHEAHKTRARLAHPLYGEVHRSRTGELRLRQLRGRIWRACAHTAVVDARDLIHRALLLLDSDLPADAALFTQAAGAAMQLLDPALAARLAGAARAVDGSYEATMLHVFALHLVGQMTESERVVAGATDTRFTPEQRGNLTLIRAGNLFWGLGLTDRAHRVLDDAEVSIPARSAGAAHAIRAIIEAASGSPQVAIDAAHAILDSTTNDVAAMGACFALMVALGHAGRFDHGADAATQGYRFAERSFDAAPMMFGYTLFHAQALTLAGYQSQADALTNSWARQTAEIPVASSAYAALFTGLTELGAGRVSNAREWLTNALTCFARFVNTRYGVIECRSALVAASAITGHLDDAISGLRILDAEDNPYGFVEARRVLAGAWVSAAQGAATEAITRSREAAEIARSRGYFAQEVVCLNTATRLGDATTTARLAELCEIVDGPRVVAAAAHARAWEASDAKGLVAASEQLEQMGDVLAAAEAAAQAATVCRAQRRQGSALSARERAQRLAQQCGAVETPALRTMETSSLTTRQREILTLAAQGLSNKEIAERLNISIRTVHAHRYRAGKK